MSAPEAAPSDAATPAKGRRGRAVLVVLAILAGLSVLAVWGAAAVVTGYSAAQDLQAARRDIVAAEGQLRDAQLTEARATLGEAIDGATSASDKLHRPYVVPLRWVPTVGTNVRAATVLSDTARDTGTAAADLLDAAMGIVHGDRDQPLGTISLEYLEELTSPTRQLADTLERTTADVQDLRTEGLIGRIEDAREQYLELAGPGADQAALAADLLEVMPGFLGEDGPRNYLIAAGALSEIRGSGGLPGSWSVLEVDEGRMDFEDFVGVEDLPPPGEGVGAPSEDYDRRYGAYGALYEYRNTNLTPDFPRAAEVMADLWAHGGGVQADGVILADTVVFERIAERAGGLEIPGHGTLAAEDTLQFVGLDAYDAFETDEERKQVLGAVATAAFAAMFQILEDDDVPATVEMLVDLAEGGHLRIHSQDPQTQAVFERAGLAGELPEAPGESAGIFLNNIAGNKVDWFGSREIEHHVRLLPDGVTSSTVEARFHNGAPIEGHRRAVLGPWTDLTEAGDNLSMVTFTCSTSCELTPRVQGTTDEGTERGRPMHDATMLLPAGESHAMRYATESTDAWWFEGDELILEVEHLVQPTLHGTELVVRVEVPTGTSVLEAPEGAETADGELVHRSQASGVVRHRYVFDASDLEVVGDDAP